MFNVLLSLLFIAGALGSCALAYGQVLPTPPPLFGAALSHLDFLGLVLAIVLSTLSGLTSLLNQMRREYRENGKIEHVRLFVASKMTGSNLAGLIVFFYAPGRAELTNGNIAVLIIVAAFGGTWFIEKLVQTLIGTLTSKGKP